MAKAKKTSSNNLIVYVLIAGVVAVSVWGVSRMISGSRQTTNSRALETSLEQQENSIERIVTTNSCQPSQIRFGRLVNAIGGEKCYDSASFTCMGGPKDGKKFNLQTPSGAGGCQSEKTWAQEAQSACECGQEDRNFGTCKYKKIEFLTGDVDNTRVSCTKASSGTCFYESQVTCENGNQYNLAARSCTRFKSEFGSSWEFFANVVCCKKIESETVGDPRPKACRQFGLHDYSLCSAYCKERGFSCVANGELFRCDDDRPESACL